ncbi:MAG: hypothetical protein K0B11_18375 [Mariniphaga sp.]|nr:hypothetical protein [Mariniphaga sp.]
MKKLILLSLFVTFFCFVNAQSNIKTGIYFIEKLSEEMSLIRLNEIDGNKIHVILTQAPSYYDIELSMIKIKKHVDSYSDVKFIKHWKKENANEYECILQIIDQLMFITFNSNNNTITFGLEKK